MGVFFKEISPTPKFPRKNCKNLHPLPFLNSIFRKNQACYHITP